MTDFFTMASLVFVVGSGIRLATPFLLAGLGETIGQRSGGLNLGVDGVMLLGAFGAYWTILETGRPVAGLLVGLGVAVVGGLFLAVSRGPPPDRFLHENGLLGPALDSLKAEGFAVTVFDSVVADPPEHVLMACIEQGKAAGADIVLGLGGGSSMDIAKLAAVMDWGMSELPEDSHIWAEVRSLVPVWRPSPNLSQSYEASHTLT